MMNKIGVNFPFCVEKDDALCLFGKFLFDFPRMHRDLKNISLFLTINILYFLEKDRDPSKQLIRL